MSEVVSSSDFQSKVLDAQGPVLVDFFATWCGPCKMLAPTLDEVAAETAGKAAVYKLDIDQSPDIAQKYGVMSVPTLMVFENGQVKNQAVGVQPKQNILSMIGLLLPRPEAAKPSPLGGGFFAPACRMSPGLTGRLRDRAAFPPPPRRDGSPSVLFRPMPSEGSFPPPPEARCLGGRLRRTARRRCWRRQWGTL